jgi:glycosyltransferase involved in cell wall biosynthesis
MLTHTDPTVDSRILKTFDAVKSVHSNILVIGLRENSWDKPHRSGEFEVFSLHMRAVQKVLGLEPVVSNGGIVSRLLSKPVLLLFYLEFYSRVFVRSLVYRPSIIHCNDWYVLPIAVSIKFLTSAKLIYDAHELEAYDNNVSSLAAKVILFVEKISWSSIDFLITVSPSIESWYLNQYGVKPSAVILNSPKYPKDMDKHEESTYLRETFNIAPKTPIFLYVGLLTRGRAIDHVLAAFSSSLTESAVVFLGKGEYEEVIRSNLKFGKNVFIHEPVPHEKVVPLAKSADYGLCLIENVSLSDYYCLPNKLFEYAFSGIPVIASNFPDISEVVEKFQLGICVEPNTEGLLRAIDLVDGGFARSNSAGNPDLRELGWEFQASKIKTAYALLDA